MMTDGGLGLRRQNATFLLWDMDSEAVLMGIFFDAAAGIRRQMGCIEGEWKGSGVLAESARGQQNGHGDMALQNDLQGIVTVDLNGSA